jgi:hypothetical protein
MDPANLEEETTEICGSEACCSTYVAVCSENSLCFRFAGVRNSNDYLA